MYGFCKRCLTSVSTTFCVFVLIEFSGYVLFLIVAYIFLSQSLLTMMNQLVKCLCCGERIVLNLVLNVMNQLVLI